MARDGFPEHPTHAHAGLGGVVWAFARATFPFLSTLLTRVALVVCALTLVVATARADSLETLTLHHRMAEDVIPILQPLLPAGAVMTGTGNVLLVRADEATLEQVRAALATLDRAPRQLLITVGQATGARGSDTSVRGSATVGSGDVQVGVNQPPRDASGAKVTVRSGSTQDDLHNVSTVRAIEGMEAYVAMGQSRPVTSTTVHRGPYSTPAVDQTTQYRDVMTGFYATPRVSGDRVTLEIAPTQQRVDPAHRDAVATASLTTTVSGRLGEWIPLGGTTTEGNGSATGILTWGTRTGTSQYTAWVKVEELPQ